MAAAWISSTLRNWATLPTKNLFPWQNRVPS